MSDLIGAEELGPFIYYWIDAMTTLDGTAEDATWRRTLLTYIEFYKYTGVNHLFTRFGTNIDAEATSTRTISASVPDQELARRLYSCVI